MIQYPNFSELNEDSMYNDAKPNSSVSPNPEPSIKYAVAPLPQCNINSPPFKSDATLKINICSAAKIVPIDTSSFFISFSIFLLITQKMKQPTK